MVVTGGLDADGINRVYDLDARYVVKPTSMLRIESFVEKAIAARSRRTRVVGVWVARYGLSGAERHILLEALRGETVPEIAAARGTSAQTVKKQVSVMLKKTPQGSLQELVCAVLREIVDL
jgi:DNA-binding NarL/FixJ family response regulator